MKANDKKTEETEVNEEKDENKIIKNKQNYKRVRKNLVLMQRLND